MGEKRVRLYGFCAKFGHEKPLDTNYVCPGHRGPGMYWFCAHCGKAWNAESACYVCWDCLVRVPVTLCLAFGGREVKP